MSNRLMCFTCKSRPAGNEYGGPFSAYCAECQPRTARPRLRGAQCGCPSCGHAFATLTDFDAHQVRHDGVFTGTCRSPASIGLAEVSDVWGTPEGNAHRVRLAARLPRLAA